MYLGVVTAAQRCAAESNVARGMGGVHTPRNNYMGLNGVINELAELRFGQGADFGRLCIATFEQD